jgi:hypothetical protein
MAPVIELAFEPMSNNGRMDARVTASCNGETVHVDKFSLDSSISRGRFINRVLEEVPEADPQELRRQLLQLVDELQSQPEARIAGPQTKPEVSDEERARAMEMLTSPVLFDVIASDIGELGVEGERQLVLMLYVVGTSRILTNPIGAIVHGASSSGKSHGVRRVAELFPPESKVAATNLSASALYYFSDPDSLVHKLLVVGERKQSASPEVIDENRALRELLSEKEITRIIATRDEVTGKMASVPYTVRGPIAYIESTTRESIFEEDASRLLPLRADESKAQTRAVMDRVAQEAMGRSVAATEREAIVARHHAAQRVLEEFTGVEVVVPFAHGIEIPSSKIIARRAFKQVISVVQVVALLRVFQKGEREEPIVADLDDYEIARELMGPVLRRQLGTLTDAGEDLFEMLHTEYAGNAAFVAGDVARLLGVTPRQAHRRMHELVQNDLVRETDRSKRNRKEWAISPDASLATVDGLPTRDEVEERLAIVEEDAPGADEDSGASDIPDMGQCPTTDGCSQRT